MLYFEVSCYQLEIPLSLTVQYCAIRGILNASKVPSGRILWFFFWMPDIH